MAELEESDYEVELNLHSILTYTTGEFNVHNIENVSVVGRLKELSDFLGHHFAGSRFCFKYCK